MYVGCGGMFVVEDGCYFCDGSFVVVCNCMIVILCLLCCLEMLLF